MLRTIFLFFFSLGNFSLAYDNDGPFRVQLKNKEHRLMVINSGSSALDIRLDLIEQAQETIDIEYFIYRRDFAGKVFSHALIQKAQKKGVKVRLLLDYFLIKHDIDPFIAHELEALGIEVRYYNTAPTMNLIRVQYRNHRKSLIVDKKFAIIGGRNIGNEYFDLDESFNFHDRDVLIEGPIVEAISDSFEIVWNSSPVKKLKRTKRPNKNHPSYLADDYDGRPSEKDYKRDLRKWQKKVTNAKKFLGLDPELFDEFKKKIEFLRFDHEEVNYEGRCDNITFAADKPGVGSYTQNSKYRIVKNEIFKRIRKTKNNLTIDSPYFIVDGETENLFEDLIKRGVQTRIFTNGLYSTDAIYTNVVLNSILSDLLEKGVEFFLVKGTPHFYEKFLEESINSSRWGTHSKHILFDEQSFMLGTYNFDPHSENYNLEMSIFCDEQVDFTRKMYDYLDRISGESYSYLESMEFARKKRFEKIHFSKKILYFLVTGPSLLFGHLL